MAENLYIGLMSGTSLDGIDAALVRFEQNKVEVIASLCLPFTASLKQKIKALINPANDEINRLMALDVELGQQFAEAVNQLLIKANEKKKTSSQLLAMAKPFATGLLINIHQHFK